MKYNGFKRVKSVSLAGHLPVGGSSYPAHLRKLRCTGLLCNLRPADTTPLMTSLGYHTNTFTMAQSPLGD